MLLLFVYLICNKVMHLLKEVNSFVNICQHYIYNFPNVIQTMYQRNLPICSIAIFVCIRAYVVCVYKCLNAWCECACMDTFILVL